MTTADPFNLARFVDAQRATFARARAEIAAGEKASHWMWFVFPQVAGLGSSPMAMRYAIRSRGEAEAYLAHPTLGPNLRDITRVANAITGKTADAIFGSPDDRKFRSSMTLFDAIAPGDVFDAALDKYFAGERDQRTVEFLSSSSPIGRGL